MTPAEKAKELVNQRFYQPLTIFLTLHNSSKEMWNYAKVCATVCVNEILNIDVWEWPHNSEYGRPFWHEVKEEIEKL